MLSLVAQINLASRYARQQAILRDREASLKAERMAEIRAKQWASRKAGGNGVAEVLLNRLPTTKETAVTLATIKQLMADTDAPESSISGALTILVTKQKRVQRTGERRDYRYYIAEGKKP